MVTSGTNNILVGGGSILNYFNDLTVWSGGAVPTQSSTGKTFVRDTVASPAPSSTDYTNVGNSPSCNSPPSLYRCSTSGTTLGPDVIANDTFLSTLTPSQYFSTFMGYSPTAYRDQLATYKLNLDGTLASANSSSLGSITGMGGEVIWAQGNVSGIGNVGSPTNPVILVINGDWNVSASSTIYGLVFVTGAVKGTGSPTIVGSLISGSLKLSGNAKVIYDPNVISAVSRLGPPAIVPGSWRDW
jgi:hypothetical protein